MGKTTAKKAGMAACIAVMVIGIAALVLYVGGFMPQIADLFAGEEATSEITQSNFEDVFVSVAQGPAEGMRAVRLEKDTDFTDITAAYKAVSDIADWGFNTVIFSGCDLSEAAQLATQAKNSGLFSAYMVDTAFIVKSGIADDSAAQSLCGIGVDSVMFYASQGITQSECALAAKTLRKYDNSLYIGAFANAEKDYSTVCISDVFDYKYVDITVPSSKIAGDYTDFVSQYCDGTTKDTVFGLHAELVGNAQGYEKPEELMNQLMSATLAPSAGFGVYRYAVLNKNNGGLRDAIVDYMTNGIMKDYFRQLNMSTPEKTRFETNQSRVSFVGTGDISQPLIINGQAVEMIGDGYFSAERELKVGENKFVIEHKGKTVTYTITYKIKLIESVIPTGNVSASGGTILDIAVIAHKSASVKALLGGNTIMLTRSDEYDDSSAADDGSDYTYFVGQCVLPESGAADRNLGKIKVEASYSGIKETVMGASVTVNKKEEFVPPVVTPVTTTVYITTVTQPTTVTENPSNEESSVVVSTTEKLTTTTKKPETTFSQHIFEHLTPYKNNGVSGKSKMVVVKKDYAEALPGNTVNDVSVPYFTALLKGTVDYVVSSESYGSIKYYKLASGRRVYQSDVEYLSQGYNMPANEIRTVGVVKSSDETKINLTMKWKVPFNVRERPQEFYTQISGRPYSVKSFTAEYVDIVFYHTALTDSAPSLNTSVIKKTQWIKNSDNSCTLRIFLNKKGGFYGIKYYYNNDGTLTLSVKERANSSISGKVIMLDPGHGGNDPGAIGVAVVGNKRVYEETINMAIANKVKSKLEALGATVIMTRTGSNKTIELDTRAALCRATNPDVFVAIHCDASESSSSASGTTAYYYKSYSYPLANSLSKSIVAAYKNNIYSGNSTMAGKADKGSIFKGFRVTRVEECPSVLIEYGFVTNVVECNALVKDSTQSVLAQATVDGLVNYFKNS